MTKRELKVAMGDLLEAFEMGSYQNRYYLDLETGKVVLMNEDTDFELERVYEQLKDVPDPTLEAISTFVIQSDLTAWQKPIILEAALVEAEEGTRFIAIPWIESCEAYQDMETFIESLEDPSLQELLGVAIKGRGAFRRFKDVLYRYPEEQQGWFTFKDARMRQRVGDWLDGEGIEPIV